MSASKIYIDPTEDVVFACAKIAAADARKVIVVIPTGANIISSQVSLKLVSRMLSRTDKIIILVMEDELGKKYAHRALLVSVAKVSDILPETWDLANQAKQSYVFAKDQRKVELLAQRSEASYEIVDQKPDIEERIKLFETQPLEITNDEELLEPIAPIEIKPEAIAVFKQPAEVPPLFTKLEPKVIDLTGYAILSGGDIAADPQTKDLINLLKVVNTNNQAQIRNSKPDNINEPVVGKKNTTPRGDIKLNNFPEEIEVIDQSKLIDQTNQANSINQINPVDSLNLLNQTDPLGSSPLSITESPSFEEPSEIESAEIEPTIPLTLTKTSQSINQIKAKFWTTFTQAKDKFFAPRIHSNLKPNLSSNNNSDNYPKANLVNRNFAHGFNYQPAPRSRQVLNSTPQINRSQVVRPNSGQRRSRLDNQERELKSSNLKSYISKAKKYINLSGMQNKKAKVTAAALVILVVFFMASIFIFPQTKINLKLNQKSIPINQKITATVDQKTVDTNALIIPLTLITKSDSRSDTGNSTGKGKTGVKSAGIIQIYNHSSAPVALASGTKITCSNNNLNYQLVDSATIPVGSLQQNVKIIATDFGPNYDLSSGAKYFIARGVNNIDLTAYTGISGGTVQDINIVLQSDYDNLKNSIISLLKQSLLSEINSLVSGSEIKLQQNLNFTQPQITSNKAVGDQADTFDISINLSANIPVVSAEDLKTIALAVVKTNTALTAGYDLNQIAVPQISNINVQATSASFDIASSGNISANINADTIKDKVLGLNTSAAQEKLNQIPDISDVQLSFSPNYLPQFLRRIPSDKNKIEVNLTK